jgi:hypothetical protein
MSRGCYSLGQRQAQQHGCVGIEDEDAHIGLAGQFKDVRQVVRHALAAVLLPKLLGGDALGVLQVLVRPGRGNQLDADRRAVRNPERDEQKASGVARSARLARYWPVSADVRAADFPAPAVVAGLETQPLHDFPRGLGRIGVADVDGAAVEVVAMDGIDHGTPPSPLTPSPASHSASTSALTESGPLLTTAKSLVTMQDDETSSSSERCSWLGGCFARHAGFRPRG